MRRSNSSTVSFFIALLMNRGLLESLKGTRRRLTGAIATLLVALSIAPSAAQSETFIFVADADSNFIRQYDLTGHEVGRITNPAFSFSTLLAADSTSLITDINFTGPDAPDLVRFDFRGNILARNSSTNIFGEPAAIVDVVDSRYGTFFVTSTLNTEIAEVDRDLRLVRRFPTFAPRGGVRIVGAAVSLDGGFLFVADFQRSLLRVFDARTGEALTGIVSADLIQPLFPRFSSSGFLYVSSPSGTDIRIQAFGLAGFPIPVSADLISQFSTGTTSEINGGHFEFLPDGNLAVLNSKSVNSTVKVFTPTGDFLFEFGNPSELIALTVADVPPPPNHPPDCSHVTAQPSLIWPPKHSLVPVGIAGVTDPDGDSVGVTVTRVTQDEPIDEYRFDHEDRAMDDGSDDAAPPGLTAAQDNRQASEARRARDRDDDTNQCPDAVIDATGGVRVRAERSREGNGRVYTIWFTASDGRGGSCDGSVQVCVPHDRHHAACVDDGQVFNSLGPCPRRDRGDVSDPDAAVGVRLEAVTRTGGAQSLRYSLSEASDVQIALYDIAGRRVITLENARQDVGTHELAWDTAGLACGMYLCRLQAGAVTLTKSVLILK